MHWNDDTDREGDKMIAYTRIVIYLLVKRIVFDGNAHILIIDSNQLILCGQKYIMVSI